MDLESQKKIFGDNPKNWPMTWRQFEDIVQGLETASQGQELPANAPQAHWVKRLAKALGLPSPTQSAEDQAEAILGKDNR